MAIEQIWNKHQKQIIHHRPLNNRGLQGPPFQPPLIDYFIPVAVVGLLKHNLWEDAQLPVDFLFLAPENWAITIYYLSPTKRSHDGLFIFIYF